MVEGAPDLAHAFVLVRAAAESAHDKPVFRSLTKEEANNKPIEALIHRI